MLQNDMWTLSLGTSLPSYKPFIIPCVCHSNTERFSLDVFYLGQATTMGRLDCYNLKIIFISRISSKFRIGWMGDSK